MKTFTKISLVVLMAAFAFGLTGLKAVFAASSPTLVESKTYSVLANTTVTNTVTLTTLSGDLGISTGGAPTNFPPGVVTLPATIRSAADALVAQTDNVNAYNALSAGANATCSDALYQFGTGSIDLAGKTLVPGVYCADAFTLSGTLTLNDAGAPNGVWIFRSGTTLITSAGGVAHVVFSTGVGLPCNVWWKVASSATISVGTTFIGNILASTSVALQTGATLNGRAMAQTGAVTLDNNTISGPTCAVALGSRPVFTGTINVVKTVINDNGGTKTVADFPLFVNGTPVISGDTNVFPTTATTKYTVTETADPNYTRTFSGDCDASGAIYLQLDGKAFCIITNNDIGAPIITPPVPPLIDVVKVPSPLALPAGPGPVTYNYTLRNIGTVPVTDVTMVDDTCSPVTLVSGDTNGDSKLDVNETWTYKCSTTLSATHTNTVVATGWANGISTTDIANATVVVGEPIVPPLIHVTKRPAPLALLAGGGTVTYTEKITNPGTVALSNVTLTDDKCSPMKYVSGDTNKDSKLDTTETWTYTCKTNLTKTTTNTAIATGSANGFTVRDLAIATVVVATAAPKLPNTGFAAGNILGNVVMLVGLLILVSASLFMVLRKRTI